MLLHLLQLAGGALFLYFGAEWLVGGSVGLALSLRIPQLVVGLTVVAYGTSAPEIVVGLQAAHGGHGDVALGNVIGSNIANLGLILGVSTLIAPARVDGTLTRRELPMLAASTLAVPAVLWDGVVSTWEGALLVLTAVVYTGLMVRAARSASVVKEAVDGARLTEDAVDAAGAPRASRSRPRLALTAAIGLVVLLVGGSAFVAGATELARAWGMSERLLGLTIVAVGTSLPELVTSVVAALRGHSDIAVGNVIGSNIFNVLLCLGASSMIGKVSGTPSALLVDLGGLIVMSAMGCIFMRSARTMARWEGATLSFLYVAFMAYVIAA
jgi:cation:H+ antiporter